jgi:hypothetical protein
MKHTLTAACVLTFQFSMAQPVITFDHAPQPGDICAYGLTHQPYEIPDGTGWTWDIADLAYEILHHRFYLELSSASGGSYFPDADLVRSDMHGEHFYELDQTGAQLVGRLDPGLFLPHLATDPMLDMIYPCSFGDNWSDTYTMTFSWDTDSGTVSHTYNGSVDWEAFSHGTVVLNGIHLPVLVLVQTTIMGDSLFEIQTSEYRILTPLSRCELAYGSIYHQYKNGTYLSTGHSLYVLQNPDLAVDDQISVTRTFRVWPVPASNKLEFDRDPDDRDVAVIDAAGRIIQNTSLSQGEPVGRLPIDALVPGHYTLKITNSSGGSKRARFVVE